MRALVPVLLFVLAVAPPAAAHEAHRATLEFDPRPAGAMLRVGEPAELAFHVNATCSPSLGAWPPIRVEHVVTRAPAWAVLVVSPPAAVVEDCDGENGATLRGVLHVEPTADAPAFQPEAVEIEARVRWEDNESAVVRSSLPVLVGYAPALDVQWDGTSLEAYRRRPAVFVLDVDNLGNGNTRVNFEVESSDPGLSVRLPPSIVLQSRQAGGTATATQVRVEAYLADNATEPQSFTLRWRSHYALDPKLPGEGGSVTFQVVPDASVPPPAPPPPVPPSEHPAEPSRPSLLWTILREIPGPSPLLVLAALAVAALAGARQRRTQ